MSNFKEGDVIICKNNTWCEHTLKIGSTYTVRSVALNEAAGYNSTIELEGIPYFFAVHRFELKEKELKSIKEQNQERAKRFLDLNNRAIDNLQNMNKILQACVEGKTIGYRYLNGEERANSDKHHMYFDSQTDLYFIKQDKQKLYIAILKCNPSLCVTTVKSLDHESKESFLAFIKVNYLDNAWDLLELIEREV